MNYKKPLTRRRLCSVKGCFNTSDSKKNITFYSFPRKPPLKEEWMKFCKDEHLFDVSDNAVKHRYICSAHFSSSCFSNKPFHGSHLIRGSVPTIYVPYSSDDIRGLKAMFQSKNRIVPKMRAENCSALYSDITKSSSVSSKIQMNFSNECILTQEKTVSGDSHQITQIAKGTEKFPDNKSTDKRIILAPVMYNEKQSLSDDVLCDLQNSKDQFSLPHISDTQKTGLKNAINCSVIGCPVNLLEKHNIKLFHFPSYENDNERFMKWMNFSGNKNVSNNKSATDFYVCSLHFDNSNFELPNKTKLKSNACPTVPSSKISTDKLTYLTVVTSEDTGETLNENNLQMSVKSLNSNLAVEDNSIEFDKCNNNNVSTMASKKDFSIECFNHKSRLSETEEHGKIQCILASDDNDVETTKCRKYKIVVTIFKEIDKRKDIKEMTHLIASSIENVVENLIRKIPNVKSATETVSQENGDNLDELNINEKLIKAAEENCKDPKETNSDSGTEVININSDETLESVIVSSDSIDSKEYPNTENQYISDEFTTANKIYCLDNSNLCSSCGFLAKTVSRLNHHINLYHEEQKCNLCDETLPNLIEFRKHLKKHKRKKCCSKKCSIGKFKKYCCEICQINCFSSIKLAKHKLITHNIGEYHTCNVCKRIFVTKYMMLYHKQTVHSTNNEVAFVCQYCGHTFKRHSNYFAHIKFMHLDQFKHVCSICKKRLRSPTALFMHMTNHVNETNKEEHDKAISLIGSSFGKRLRCLVCSVRFTNGDVDAFKRHMGFHENELEVRNLVGDDKSKFKCVICNMNFPNIGKLAVHRYYHHKETPYICNRNNCDSTFWSSWDLALHQRTLHVKLKFACNICTEKFSSVQKKANHIKIEHSDYSQNNKPMPCKICGKLFTVLYDLQMHMVVHNSIKLYKCELCDEIVKTASAFKSHILNHNKNEYQKSFKPKVVWRSKEQQENINKVFNDIGELVEDMADAEDNEHVGVAVEEEIIGVIDYSQF